MPQKQQYPPLLPKFQDWPIVQLNKQHQAFIAAVVAETVQKVLAAHATTEALRAMLCKTAALELVRAQKQAWQLDPPDEVAFWMHWVATLPEQPSTALPTILHEIVSRYAQEMMGRFRITHYRAAKRVVPYVLSRLLTPVSLRSPWQLKSKLQKKLHVTGAIDQLRALTLQGTVVMVPTHFSHLDSLLLGWVIQTLGLPYFIYGAGLNLFNSRFFGMLMNNMGVYKIDRRRKNLPYLTVLKAYASLALQWGCHSLFYPGGTRSRSGALEQRLKLGLLGTAFEAQQRNYAHQGPTGRKLFVVPVVLSYHCVLEAPQLIKSYLAAQGVRGLKQKRHVAFPRQLWHWADNIFRKESNIVVSIGEAMDLLGNRVDEAGNSYDAQGQLVDTYQHFMASAGEGSRQYEADTRALSQAIVRGYHKANCVLTSHLLAFTAFTLLKQQHAGLSLQALLQLPPAQLVIPYAQLEATFARLQVALLQLHSMAQVQVEPALQGTDIPAMIQEGLYHLGLYHAHRPLLQNQAGDITTQALSTLLYYHNRLQGYDLDKYLS
ncbi:MAG: 1-acyl-sn-glycerol-3-phosphate acyltransferase [Bacteroidota bacterium]